jgi:hypothetical protein
MCSALPRFSFFQRVSSNLPEHERLPPAASDELALVRDSMRVGLSDHLAIRSSF